MQEIGSTSLASGGSCEEEPQEQHLDPSSALMGSDLYVRVWWGLQSLGLTPTTL